MESYHTKKGDIARHFKEGESVVEWSFNDQLIFARLKSYLSRLHIVEVSPSIGLVLVPDSSHACPACGLVLVPDSSHACPA